MTPRPPRLDVAQARLLLAGACLDAPFGLAMLVARQPVARLLRVAIPDEPVWFELCGVLLLILGGAYLVVARAPSAWRHATAAVAGAGRVAGAVVLARAFARGQGATFLAVACLDFTLGVSHLAVAASHARAARGASP